MNEELSAFITLYNEKAEAELEEEKTTSPINEQAEDKGPSNVDLSASPINITDAPAQTESVTSEVATTFPELNEPNASDQFNIIANINVEQTGAEGVATPSAELVTAINETPEVMTSSETGASGIIEINSESTSTSSFMNSEFSKMLVEEIANSFIAGDVFGGIKNELNNIFGGETAAISPVNESNVALILEKKDVESESASESTAIASSFMNSDFSKMSVEEITNSFIAGDVFGGIKNELNNIFGEEIKSSAVETSQPYETIETGGFLSNIFSKGIENKTEEIVERGATRMNAPIISTSATNAPVSQENSSTNITTNQLAETSTPAVPVSNQTSNISNNNSDQSTSENMESNRSSIIQNGSDNSDMVNRLRRIERLLSGPLEVKIVES